jgi:tRNA (guanine-N7-)-methyltransferase
VFGNANPVEIEVGFGKGLFLLRSATERPTINFFGIEIERKYQLFAANRIAKMNLTNVKTCCADAKAVLRLAIPASSVSAIHVYFPDPWWKSRHKKRLLFTPEFADLVLTALMPGGILHFATDVADYFEMVSQLLSGLSRLEQLPPPEVLPPRHDMDYLTNFERKFRQEGRPIYRSNYQKRN